MAFGRGPFKAKGAGSSPAQSTRFVAQLVAQLALNEKVAGSNPVKSAKNWFERVKSPGDVCSTMVGLPIFKICACRLTDKARSYELCDGGSTPLRRSISCGSPMVRRHAVNMYI